MPWPIALLAVLMTITSQLFDLTNRDDESGKFLPTQSLRTAVFVSKLDSFQIDIVQTEYFTLLSEQNVTGIALPALEWWL